MKPKQSTLTINAKDKLFVIGTEAGSTCLGFDVCYERSQSMAEWLGVESPDESFKGTIEGYERFKELVEACRHKYEMTGIKCPCELATQLVGLEGKTVEVEDKWGERRRFTVGRSTGWIPIHLELKNKKSQSGEGVTGAPFKSVRVIA